MWNHRKAWLLLLAFLAFEIASFTASSPLNGVGTREFTIEIATLQDITGKPAAALRPRSSNPLHALVVFTKFKGEAPGDTLVPAWSNDLFTGKPGSVNDYFDAVSFGQFKITGEIYPRLIELPADTTYYRTDDIYSPDVIRILDSDPNFDFSKYDNDGPDGKPNSGDDDGFVDYVILMPRSRPYNFIMRWATGVMSLSMGDPYLTSRRNPLGDPIIVDSFSGCIAVAPNRAEAIGTVVAEIAHAFDAIDLMDKAYDTPNTDSAGAGYWDVLAWGAGGWGWTGVPVGPCAYNRMRMNCVGIANSNLVDLYGSREGIRVPPSCDRDGKVYRIWMGEYEYFLIEHRSNKGSYFYDMQLPKSGLLIWHVNENESNSDESCKCCDLECPDGLFRDKGYPLGEKPDPLNGGDNLDFWSRDVAWRNAHAGNCGDSTDVFDGVVYTEFRETTNPNSRSERSSFPAQIEIYNIRRDGRDMIFDCRTTAKTVVQPPKLPTIGMGYQRSRSAAPVPEAKEAFLVSYRSTMKPDLLVMVSGDSLNVYDMTDLSEGAVQKAVLQGLSGKRTPGDAMIARQNIVPETFAAMTEEFGVRSGDLNGGRLPLLVQKLVLSEMSRKLPEVVELRQNYPNPFNAETVIPYILSSSGPVVIEIYNILGQKVFELDQGFRERGSHAARFSAGDMSSGIYFYCLRGAVRSQAKRFTLIR